MLKTRLIISIVFFWLVWPAFSAYYGFWSLRYEVVSMQVPDDLLTRGVVMGLYELAPEILQVGLVMALACVISAWLTWRKPGIPPRRPYLVLAAEPLLFSWSLLCGLILEYPTLLTHAALAYLHDYSVFWASGLMVYGLLLSASVIGYLSGGGRGLLRLCLFAVAWMGLGWLIAQPLDLERARSSSNSIVILGLDSLSQETSDLAGLRGFAREEGGTWFERPVTPALLTNAVWTSIVACRPVDQTGVFFVNQMADWNQIPDNLVARAKLAGYTTFSYFSDQFTTYVGSTAPFDHDRSGPIGWKQATTSHLKNTSFFLPVMLSRLTLLPGARTPWNHSGTYTYNLRREILDILSAGSSCPKSLVAAHLDYLHQPRYPSYSELNAKERSTIRAARSSSLVDYSVNWQMPVRPDEPLQIYGWKQRQLQVTLLDCLRRTGFLQPARKNKLLLFSDHGPRRGMTPRNFGNANFYRVPLIGFYTESRDPSEPISLIDIADLVGLHNPGAPGPADPVVQYANSIGDEWTRLMQDSKREADGTTRMVPSVLRQVGQRLHGYRPYGDGAGYFPLTINPSARTR